MRDGITQMSRRSFMASTAGALSAPFILKATRSVAQSNSVTAVNFGGSYEEATAKAVYEPFTAETGIEVNVVPYSGLDRIKAMQLTGNVEIDVHYCAASEGEVGSRQGLWEELDHSQFDLEDLIAPPTKDYAPIEIAPRGISWVLDKFESKEHPTDFADFFDLEKFPGRRAIRAVPHWTLEIALLGDGVAPADLYPLDLDRAFKSLDRIKSNIIWAATTPQDISLLQNGEVDFSITNSNRAKATNDPDGGVPVGFSFDQVVIFKDSLAIPKGAPNKENAMKLIAFNLRPEVQANFMNIVAYSPVSRKAAGMLSPEVKEWQPDFQNPKHGVINDNYWAENYEEVHHRFQEWRLI